MSYIAITLIAYLPFQADTPKAPMLWWPEAANGVCANGVHTSYQRGVGLLDSESVMIRWEAELPDTSISTPYLGSVVYDVDLDGVPEVLVTYQGATGSKLVVMDGPSGMIEWVWTCPNLTLDRHAPSVGDVDLDGHPEIVMRSGNVSLTDSTRVICLDGVTREVKWNKVILPPAPGGAPNISSPTIANLNWDPYLEIVVTGLIEGFDFAMFCLSGKDGSILWRRDSVRTRLAACWDVNGDGITEVIASHIPDYHLIALSGLDGSMVWHNTETNVYAGNDGPTIADADGDGEWEIIVYGDYGSYGYNEAIFWFDGKTGALERMYLPNKHCWDSGIPITGQLDSDPALESVAWFPKTKSAICVDGASAGEQWEFSFSNSALFKGAVADMDDDGENEVVLFSWEENYLLCLSRTGEKKWGMDFSYLNYHVTIRPIVADVDGDGYLEIILTPAEGQGSLRVRCIDNERALPAKEEEKTLRPPTMLALPGRLILTLLDPCPVDLSIYDLAGRKIGELYKGQLPAGTYEFELTGLEPGVYVARLSYDGVMITKAVVMRR
ncbi:MAG: hypothetical protein ABIM74_09740 [candidate division WOR-3 bacterium]